jgi:hypothetical protein
MNRLFIETTAFRRSWESCGMNDGDFRRLQYAIAENPNIGPVIEGTGGLRKLRWSLPPKGKSGSVRIIHVDFEYYKTTYMIYAYSKNEKEDLTPAEKMIFKRLIKEIKDELKDNSV